MIMRCNRCSGLVIRERLYAPEAIFEGYKCIACGEVFDEVVLRNRHERFSTPTIRRRPARSGRSIGR
jgi:RNA polymerase sigma-32 factor